MRQIKFGDIKISDLAKSNMSDVLESNWLTAGKFVKQFEQKWNSKFGYKYSLATSSGTDADINLCLALYELGAKRGDEILCPASTFVATANSIIAAGFIPKFVDVTRKTLNMDHNKIEQSITDKTVAIMPVHLMGKPCNMDAIMGIAKAYDLWVLEDCCEAHGAKYKGKLVGHFGLGGTFSFHVSHLVVCGEGGMISTNNSDVSEIIKSTISHGRKSGNLYFNFERFGLNSKMNDMEASIGVAGLEVFDKVFEQRRANIKYLLSALSDLEPEITLYHEDEKNEIISPHAFALLLNSNRYNEFYDFMNAKGIESKTLFGSLPTQHKAFSSFGYKIGDFPEAEYLANHGLHFGIHQHLDSKDLTYIADVIHEFLAL